MDRFSISVAPKEPIGHVTEGTCYNFDVQLEIKGKEFQRAKNTNPSIKHLYGLYYLIVGHVKEYYPIGRAILNAYGVTDIILGEPLRIVDCGLFKAVLRTNLLVPKTFEATCLLRVQPPKWARVESRWEFVGHNPSMAMKFYPAVWEK